MHASGARVTEVAPLELRAQLERGDRVRLVDVREPLEHRVASVDGAELVPLGELADAVGGFGLEDDIVVMSHHGIRSRMACEYLVNNGFTRVRNLAGGIDRWSREADPSVPRY